MFSLYTAGLIYRDEIVRGQENHHPHKYLCEATKRDDVQLYGELLGNSIVVIPQHSLSVMLIKYSQFVLD